MTSIIIPAHNEAVVIGRLLGQLVPSATSNAPEAGDLDVIVVANGCDDNTADIATSFGPSVRVISIPVASKYEALLAGSRVATSFPQVYVDADVELRAQDVRFLVRALREPGVLAAAPKRIIDMAGCSSMVRSYFQIWTRLPEVRRALWGRGVIAVRDSGQERLADLPPLLGDDLAASLIFPPHERAIVPEARVVVHAPRSFRGLVRCRVRVATAISQIERSDQAPESTERTRLSHLSAVVLARPRTAVHLPAFLLVTVLARRKSRRIVAQGDYKTWLRDDSSRNVARQASAPRT